MIQSALTPIAMSRPPHSNIIKPFSLCFLFVLLVRPNPRLYPLVSSIETEVPSTSHPCHLLVSLKLLSKTQIVPRASQTMQAISHARGDAVSGLMMIWGGLVCSWSLQGKSTFKAGNGAWIYYLPNPTAESHRFSLHCDLLHQSRRN